MKRVQSLLSVKVTGVLEASTGDIRFIAIEPA